MLKKLLIATILCAAGIVYAIDLVEGKQYTLIQPPVLVTEAADKIEVIEFFSYGCPHCSTLEPYFQKWTAQQPSNVVVKRVPVEFAKGWEGLAKLYYTAEMLNVVEKMNPIIFSTLQSGKTDLTNEDAAADLFVQNGVTKTAFKEAYNSFAVTTDLSAGRLLVQQYKVTSVPLIVVDGRYKTNLGMAGGPEGVVTTLNALLKKREDERKAVAAKPK